MDWIYLAKWQARVPITRGVSRPVEELLPSSEGLRSSSTTKRHFYTQRNFVMGAEQDFPGRTGVTSHFSVDSGSGKREQHNKLRLTTMCTAILDQPSYHNTACTAEVR